MQYIADRLDPPLVLVRVDDAPLLVAFGAWLTGPVLTREKIDAARRISFARLSSAFSRSSWRNRSLASVVIPSRSPVSISHLAYLSGVGSFGVMGELASYRLNRCPLKRGTPLKWSTTIRIALSLTWR